jgi:Na+/H+-dicarboxylate symporter
VRPSDKKRLGLAEQTMIGFALGAGVGVFLGEYAGPLGLIGDVWIRLLQMAILPYIVLSLISAIGGLTYSDARLIAGRAGIVMLGVWIVAIAGSTFANSISLRIRSTLWPITSCRRWCCSRCSWARR